MTVPAPKRSLKEILEEIEHHADYWDKIMLGGYPENLALAIELKDAVKGLLEIDSDWEYAVMAKGKILNSNGSRETAAKMIKLSVILRDDSDSWKIVRRRKASAWEEVDD